MNDDMRRRSQEVPGTAHPLSPAAFARLQAEVDGLRREIGKEVRTRRVVVVDDAGVERMRLSADKAGCRVVLLAPDGFERLLLEDGEGIGALRITGRSAGSDPTRVDVFAVDPEDEQGVYVGVELVEAGTTVAGFTAMEGRRPRIWTVHDLHD
jgi:hypothetical protein